MDECVGLKDNLKNFISNIKLEFKYKSISIDFLDYFPLLKKGVTIKRTITDIIHIYLKIFWKYNNFPTVNNIFDKIFNKDINEYYVKFEFIPDANVLNNIDSLVDDNTYSINETELMQDEKILSGELYVTTESWSSRINNTNKEALCEILILCSSPIILEVLLSSDKIRLLYNIINEDAADLISCFDFYAIDPRVGDNDLYKLARCCEKSNIKFMIEKIQAKYGCLHLSKIFNYLSDESSYIHSFEEYIENKLSELTKKCSSSIILMEIIEVNFHDNLVIFLKTLPVNNNFVISNIIKEESIKRNWIEKQILIKNFEELIGPSDVPNNIFNHINTLRC